MSRPILLYAANLSFLIPVIPIIFQIRRFRGMILAMAGYVIFSLISTGGEFILSKHGIENLQVSNWRFVIDSLWMIVVYYLAAEQHLFRRLLGWIGLLFLLFSVADKMFLESADEINIILAVTSRVVMVASSIAVLIGEHHIAVSALHNRSEVWIAGGTLLYSTGTIIVVGFGNQLMKLGTEIFVIAWYVNWFLAVIMNLMYTKAFLCKIQQ